MTTGFLLRRLSGPILALGGWSRYGCFAAYSTGSSIRLLRWLLDRQKVRQAA
jgi:hypothetical protein